MRRNKDKELTTYRLLWILIVCSATFWFIGWLAVGFGGVQIYTDSVILTFIGILATFVVVSQYVQVQDVERKIDDKIAELEEKSQLQREETLAEMYSNFANSALLSKNNEVAIIYLTIALDKYLLINSDSGAHHTINELNVFTKEKYTAFNSYFKEKITENLSSLEDKLKDKNALLSLFVPIKNSIENKFDKNESQN